MFFIPLIMVDSLAATGSAAAYIEHGHRSALVLFITCVGITLATILFMVATDLVKVVRNG